MNDRKTTRDSYKLQLRLPDGLEAEIRRRAELNGRSLTAEINQLLVNALGCSAGPASHQPERMDDADMLDRIALALLPDTVRGMHGLRYADKPKKAIRDAYHTAKLLMAARAEYLSQKPEA